MLAAVAMAVSAKRYCERQYDPVAMMKTLGGSRTTIRRIYLLHLSLVTVFSVVIGLVIGYALQSVGASYLISFMDTSLPPAGPRPWLLSIAVGVVCAMMFSLKPLLDYLIYHLFGYCAATLAIALPLAVFTWGYR